MLLNILQSMVKFPTRENYLAQNVKVEISYSKAKNMCYSLIAFDLIQDLDWKTKKECAKL